jgi:hypothetical protein
VKPAGLAHGGIPQSLFQAPNGLALVIDPFTTLKTFVLAAFDSVEVYVDGKPTSVIKMILPGEEQNRILLYLPAGRLANGVNQLSYRVTRVSGNFEDSDPLDVLFHDPAPGEPAPASMKLEISPRIVQSGVGPADAAKGVLFTFVYPYARAYDLVRLQVGTQNFEFEVVDPKQPITLTLFTADFQKVGDNDNTPLKFTVTDQLNNSNQSSTLLLNIHVSRLDLLPPTVKGQTGNNLSPTLQDIRVVVPQGSLLPTYKVWIQWQGAISTPAASFTSPQRLVSAGLEFVVPRSVLAYSLGKPVTIIYFIERAGKTTPSLPLALNILTLPATALIPPKIVEAGADNVIDVIALGTKNATIHALLHTLIEAGQPCWLSVEGKKPDGSAHNLALWNGLPAQTNDKWISQGYWPHALSNSYLKQLGHGTSLTIKYKVSLDKSNDPKTATVFADRKYTIKAVEQVVPTLVNVLDASGKEVSEAGQTISTTLKLKGTASKGQQVEIYDGSGASAVSKGKATADATTGAWELTITVAAGAHRLYAKSLYHSADTYSNVRNLTVVVEVVPAITSLRDSAGVSVPNGGSTYQTGITLNGTAAPNQQLQILLNGTARANVTANASGAWTYSIAGLAVFSHRFIARAMPAGKPDSAPWTVNVLSEWKDHFTDFQNGSYNGWIAHTGARSGSIRVHAGVKAFFNFTDQGPATGFRGTVFYQDFLFLPGTYSFWMQACHVADSPDPKLVNPILSVIAALPNLIEDKREVPKNGIWYDFRIIFNVPGHQFIRLYINNHQDGSNGNDFGIRNIRVVRDSGGGGGVMETINEAPLYTGPLPEIELP